MTDKKSYPVIGAGYGEPVVAPTTIAYGLGKMYQAMREMQDRSTKDVGVFRTRDEALAFLGLE